jgi:hypothetical protein
MYCIVSTALLPLQIVAHKVYLAVPSECPVGPDSKPRKTPSQGMGGRTGAGVGVCRGWGEGRGWEGGHRALRPALMAARPVHRGAGTHHQAPTANPGGQH